MTLAVKSNSLKHIPAFQAQAVPDVHPKPVVCGSESLYDEVYLHLGALCAALGIQHGAAHSQSHLMTGFITIRKILDAMLTMFRT